MRMLTDSNPIEILNMTLQENEFQIVPHLKTESNLYLNTLCQNLQGTFVIFIAISSTIKPSLKNIEASMPF